MARISAFLLPLLLAACGSGDPGANQAAGAPAAPAQDDAATARFAPASAAPKTAGLTTAPLTPEGWGPLKIGMTMAEITAALGPDSDPDAAGGADPASCDQFRPARAPRGMLVMVEQGRLSRISLTGESKLRSDRGLGVGASRDEVTRAYGAAAVPSSHKYGAPPAGYLDAWVGGGGGDSFIPPPSARGIRYEIDDSNRVGAIHAGGPSIQYVEGCS